MKTFLFALVLLATQAATAQSETTSIDAPAVDTLLAVQTNEGIRFQWTNLTEVNIAHYKIERSLDGENFGQVMTLRPLKNDNGEASYTATDLAPGPGNNFYRLMIKRDDGNVYYTGIVRVTNGSVSTRMNLYPNPLRDHILGIQVDHLPPGDYVLRIYSTLAQLMQTHAFHHEGGLMSESMILNNIRRGVYHISIGGPVQLQQKLLVE